MMYRSILIALREVRTFLQDRADLAFSLVLPVAIFALMYGAFSTTSLFHGTAYIVNEDQQGEFATRLLTKLSALKNLDIKLLTPAKAEAELARSDLLMVFYIPKDFSNNLATKTQAQLVFKQRGNGGLEGQIVANIIRGMAEEMALELKVRNQVKNILTGKDISQELIKTTVQKFLDREQKHPIVETKTETIGSRPDPVNQFMPGIITMFALFAISLNARTLVEERKKGTLERLLTTRLKLGELFVGKFLANVGRGFVQIFILLTLAYLVFKIFTPQTFLLTLFIGLIFASAASALGLLIGSIAHTEDQAVWIGVVFTMVMVMLGGTFFEISKGSVLYTLSRVSINTYANETFKMIINEGSSLFDVRINLIILLLVIALGLSLSRIFFKVMQRGR